MTAKRTKRAAKPRRPRPERTSARVATIAGKILRNAGRLAGHYLVMAPYGRGSVTMSPTAGLRDICTLEELRALAASALTQSPPAPARKTGRTATK